MIRTLIFDFGNVVGFFDHWQVTRRLAAHGEVAAEELHAFLFGGPLEDDYEAGRISSAEFLRHVREKARLRCSEEVLVTSYTDIFWPNPDVCGLLPRQEDTLPVTAGQQHVGIALPAVPAAVRGGPSVV